MAKEVVIKLVVDSKGAVTGIQSAGGALVTLDRQADSTKGRLGGFGGALKGMLGPLALVAGAVAALRAAFAFLAQGVRYLVDGYDKDFIRDTMEKDRDIFLQRIGEGSKVYRAYGDCAPAWGMIGTIIGMIIIGAIAGFLARALVPGKDSMSIPATIILGIVGSFVGGFLASLIFNSGSGDFLRPSGLIGSVIGAIIALLVYNATAGRKGRTHSRSRV